MQIQRVAPGPGIFFADAVRIIAIWAIQTKTGFYPHFAKGSSAGRVNPAAILSKPFGT